MRSLLSLAAVAAVLLPAAFAVPGPGTVQLDFQKRKVPAGTNKLARRQTSKTINSGITNLENMYLINVTVGTPPQSIGLQLDTGSSDIWFPSASSYVCRSGGCIDGSYNASKSSTYSNPGYGVFQIEYVDGTQVAGQYISDVFSVGGTTVTNLTMASATQTGDEGNGIMGVGFRADESSAQNASPFTYPNIIDALVSQGKINTRSYSLWLDDLASNTGSILFGGVDTSKYSGSLISIPIQKDAQSGTYTSFTVAWTSLTVTGGGQTYNEGPSSPQPVILDSGTTLTLLPDSIANSIFNGVGVVTDRNYGNVVPCGLANDQLTFSFQFGGSSGPRVNVSISEFVLPFGSSGKSPKFTKGPYSGQTVCLFGIDAAGSNPILFGDTFLRSAYVVYDLDNLEIGLAQTNQNSNSGTGNVKAFTSGSGMPDASTTITSVVVSASAVKSNNPNIVQSTYGATTDAGDALTTRTPTFSLVRSTASGSSSSSSAAAPITVPSVQRSTIAVVGVTLGAFMFGMMML